MFGPIGDGVAADGLHEAAIHPLSSIVRPLYCAPTSAGKDIAMDAAGLRALQAPIKERYKTEPAASLITLRAKGTLDDSNIACKVETGRAVAVAGLHPATGGSGLELCSGDM